MQRAILEASPESKVDTQRRENESFGGVNPLKRGREFKRDHPHLGSSWPEYQYRPGEAAHTQLRALDVPGTRLWRVPTANGCDGGSDRPASQLPFLKERARAAEEYTQEA